jgi:ribosomal protein S18 acetylase RimI-like enzyme
MYEKNNSLKFRSLNQCDVDELFDFFNDLNDEAKLFFHPHEFDKNNLIDLCLSKKDRYFVMCLDDKIIGYSMLRLFGFDIPSYGCCIHPDFNGMGYGKELTRLTLETANKIGYNKVILKVNKNNKIAFNLYKKIGFKVVGENKETKEIKMEIILV